MKRIGETMPGAIVELLRAAPLSPGKVEFAWKMTVGRALERATLVALDEQTIVVTVCTRQWARELHRATPMILRKLERYLGAGVVTGLKVHLGPVDKPQYALPEPQSPSADSESPIPNPQSPIPNP